MARRTLEQSRLLRFILVQEKLIQDALQSFLDNVTSDSVLEEINDLLDAGSIEAALDIVDTHLRRASAVVPVAFLAAARKEADKLATELGASALGIKFDPSDTAAAAIMQRSRLAFISNISDTQRQATRQALVQGFQDGAGPAATSRIFRESLGLAPRQVRAIQNFRRLLETGDRRALDRVLRDRRFDRTVNASIRDDKPLSAKQVDTMVSRYTDKHKKFRAETVARTEAVRVTSEARDTSLRQMIDTAGISEDRVSRTFNTTLDGRERDHHHTMIRRVTTLNEPFIDGKGNELRYPGDSSAPLDTIVDCRCTVTHAIKKS